MTIINDDQNVVTNVLCVTLIAAVAFADHPSQPHLVEKSPSNSEEIDRVVRYRGTPMLDRSQLEGSGQ